LPVVGEFARRLLRGGSDVTGATLTRFYGIHVAVLPALTTACLGLHLYLVQRHGMSVPPGIERDLGRTGKMAFLPNFLLRDVIGWLIALGALATLAAFFPRELGQKADPFLPAPAGIRPEWYFMFMFQTLKYLPSYIVGIEGEVVGVVGFALAGLFLLLLPFIDRQAAHRRPSPLFTWLGVAIIAYILVLTYLGYTVSPTK
jgi:quinol-cytochrome oxidoreductase complex cytochrome b subunit